MMKRELTAIVLCVLAQAAAADCVQATAATHATSGAQHVANVTPVVNPSNSAPVKVQAPQNAARPSGELIKTAAASTRDDAPPVPRATAGTRTTQQDEDHPHRDTTAMLLAALALMSGIALRRYGSRDA